MLSGLTKTSSRMPIVLYVLKTLIGNGQIGRNAKSQKTYIDVCGLRMRERRIVGRHEAHGPHHADRAPERPHRAAGPTTRLDRIRASPQPATMKTAGNENHGDAIAPSAIAQADPPRYRPADRVQRGQASTIAMARSSEYCFTSLE